MTSPLPHTPTPPAGPCTSPCATPQPGPSRALKALQTLQTLRGVLGTGLLAALLAALLTAAPVAWADVGPDQAAAVAAQVSGGGRVLSVDRVAGGRAWRVKVVTARGEVRVVMVDAATGRPQ